MDRTKAMFEKVVLEYFSLKIFIFERSEWPPYKSINVIISSFAGFFSSHNRNGVQLDRHR